MKKYYLAVVKIVLFIVFVWAARHFWGVLEVDGCFDDGGVIQEGICVGSRHGQWVLASSRPILGWLTALGIPALAIWLTYEFMYSLIKRKWCKNA